MVHNGAMPKNDGLKITILGSGTSTGVPMPGCDCPVCHSENPRNHRLRTSALISFRGKNILIDVGPDFRQQMLTAKVAQIDAVVFTHAHADHVLGVDDLRVYNFKLNGPIPCYGTKDTLDQIKRIFYYVFDRDPRHMGGSVANLDLHPFENFESLNLFGLAITPFPLVHGNVAVTGFRFGNFAYATDCKEISDEARACLAGIDVMVLDGLREKEHPTHMTIAQAIEAGEKLGVKKLYLIHMSHSVEYEAVSKTLPGWVELAYDGLEINL